LLEIDALTKHFSGEVALQSVTLRVREREIVALVGPNGAGKSTLLKTIAGVERPTSGAVWVDGSPVHRLAVHRIRRRGVAIVMQTPLGFMSMSVLENVLLGAMFGCAHGVLSEPEARRRATRALQAVGLEHRAGDPVSSLNLHEQRFVELARALAAQPRVLLLDEVMAGLNDAEVTASVEILRRLRDDLGMTILWVEHVMSAVTELAERVIVLNFGRILAEGEPGLVLRNPEVVHAYLGEAQVA
jgi:branched-chain amino acid transport system permease protein